MVKYVPDYYKVLDINSDADETDIKKAYKSSLRKYEQKKTSKVKNKKMIKLINDAYIVLSDDKKRRKYDKLRSELIKNKKANNQKNNIENTLKVVNDVKDNYDLISKLFKVGSGTMKGKSIFTGTNIIIGGAMAGYGIKKGKDYMANRGKKNRE